MESTKNYIQWLRGKVGHEKIILVFAGGCIRNDKGEILLQRRADSAKWGFPITCYRRTRWYFYCVPYRFSLCIFFTNSEKLKKCIRHKIQTTKTGGFT